MRNALIAVCATTLIGCVTVPSSKLTWQSGDVSVSAKRSGCSVGGIEVQNNGSQVAKVFGDIDILDDQSNNLSVVSFSCDNAHPGGTAICRHSQTFNNKKFDAKAGIACPAFSKYKLSIRKY